MRLPHTMCVARVRGGTSRGCWDTLISHVHGKGITFIGSNLDHQACQVLMDLYRPFAVVNRMLNYANNYLWIVSDMCNKTYYHVLSSIPICPPKKANYIHSLSYPYIHAQSSPVWRLSDGGSGVPCGREAAHPSTLNNRSPVRWPKVVIFRLILNRKHLIYRFAIMYLTTWWRNVFLYLCQEHPAARYFN